MRHHRAQGPPNTSRVQTATPRASLLKKVSGYTFQSDPLGTAPLALVVAAAGITKMAPGRGEQVVHAALGRHDTTGRASAAAVPAIS